LPVELSYIRGETLRYTARRLQLMFNRCAAIGNMAKLP
jgi:hypothetical protein